MSQIIFCANCPNKKKLLPLVKIYLLVKSERKKLNRLKAVLDSQGRRQTWLAEQLDLTFTTVNGWCNNRSQPRLEEFIRIAELLNVSLAELIVDANVKRKRPENSSGQY